MKTWLVKDARAHLGDVISGALRGEPKRIAPRGRDDAVLVLSERDWERRSDAAAGRSFEEHLLAFPLSHDEWLEVAPGPLPLRSRTLTDNE